MIGILFNRHEFEYDAYTLVKAFYPEEDVENLYGEAPPAGKYSMTVTIDYEDDGTAVVLTRGESEVFRERVSFPEGTERKERKNRLKQVLYRGLSGETGKKLPWGNLTGIRPTKITMGLLESGMSNVQTAEYMRNTYFTDNAKTALAVTIANRERELLKDIDYKSGYSLYVGIPFCPSICLYCSFSSSPLAKWRDKVDDYLSALLKELSFISEVMKERPLDTVYIGGGTPTTLEPEQLERLLGHIDRCFPVQDVKEYTIEAGRPDSITREKLLAIRRHPVTRISVNPQTMNQGTLDLIGRKHTVEDTRHAFALARECGFDNINMDLIVGLPGENAEDVRHTLEEVRTLDPDSLTVHSLAVKRATRLHLFKEKYQEMSFENNQEIMDLAMECARNCGMGPYYLYRQKNMSGNLENVGYAKPGKAGIYNILIMEEKQSILAAGAGAATKFVFEDGERIERAENVKDVTNYIDRIDEMIERKRSGLKKYLNIECGEN